MFDYAVELDNPMSCTKRPMGSNLTNFHRFYSQWWKIIIILYLNSAIGLNATLIKKQIFLIYKEIQSGAVSKSYMRKGLLIYEEIRKYFPIYEERRPLVIYDLATAPF